MKRSVDPLVSIIVNNYNYERFLPEAIDSALAQSYERTEVLVVDDGSTDGSREVIRRYGDRVSAVLKENEGQPATISAGFAACRGDIVIFVDADDALLPEAAANAARLLRDGTLAKVHWPLIEVDEDGHETGELRPDRPLKAGDLSELVIRDGPTPESYATPPMSGSAWSRGFLAEVFPGPEPGPRTAGGASGIDSYLSTLAPLHGLVGRVEQPQGRYRVHGGNRYALQTDAEKVAFDRRSFEHRCRALAEHCRARGIEVDPEAWRRRSWRARFPLAKADIARVVPAGEPVILVDEDDIGPDVADGRPVLPFPERNGLYWGPPADDDSAIRELERLRGRGARFIVFGWTAFWWLDHYSEFERDLRSRFRPVLENDRVVVFELRP